MAVSLFVFLEETAGTVSTTENAGLTSTDGAIEKDDARELGDTEENGKTEEVEGAAAVNGQSTEEGLHIDEKGEDLTVEVKDDKLSGENGSEDSKGEKKIEEEGSGNEQKTEAEENIVGDEGVDQTDSGKADGEGDNKLTVVVGEEGDNVTNGREDLVSGTEAEPVDQGGADTTEQQIVEDTTGEQPVGGETIEASNVS